MEINLKGKTAIVTGGAGGIGLSIVKGLLDCGAKVAILGSNQTNLDRALEEVRGLGTAITCRCDLSDLSAIGPAVTSVRQQLGEIDILVQSHGLLRGKAGLDLSPQEWNEVISVNLSGLFFMMQQVVSQSMKDRGGAIVNISSMAGIRGMTPPMCSAHYSASKGGVVAVTMQGAVEWASLGIRVNAIAPGGVLTGGMAAMGGPPPQVVAPVPMKKLSMPEDIANAACFLSSDLAAMITGQTLVIDGGSSVVGY